VVNRKTIEVERYIRSSSIQQMISPRCKSVKKVTNAPQLVLRELDHEEGRHTKEAVANFEGRVGGELDGMFGGVSAGHREAQRQEESCRGRGTLG
jgi:hypothetical protein